MNPPRFLVETREKLIEESPGGFSEWAAKSIYAKKTLEWSQWEILEKKSNSRRIHDNSGGIHDQIHGWLPVETSARIPKELLLEFQKECLEKSQKKLQETLLDQSQKYLGFIPNLLSSVRNSWSKSWITLRRNSWWNHRKTFGGSPLKLLREFQKKQMRQISSQDSSRNSMYCLLQELHLGMPPKTFHLWITSQTPSEDSSRPETSEFHQEVLLSGDSYKNSF